MRQQGRDNEDEMTTARYKQQASWLKDVDNETKSTRRKQQLAWQDDDNETMSTRHIQQSTWQDDDDETTSTIIIINIIINILHFSWNDKVDH